MAIRILDSHVASTIAAGEVVERPSSVVKELVENSLDAGASSISVEIEDGGLKLIRVVDNGDGITSSEARIAVERFATSKIVNGNDLEYLSTLGFRGEALPSIAAVSNMTLVSRTSEEVAGTLLKLNFGEIVIEEPYGSPKGTTVSVERLFSNTPARLKFLKSHSSEAHRVQVVVQRLAFSFPSVSFRVTQDGRRTFSTIGSGDLVDVCSSIYGVKLARDLIRLGQDFESEDTGFRLRVGGLISPPHVNRASRGYINLLINRRWVQNRTLVYAIEQAYRGFLTTRKYPVAIIGLDIPPSDLDVNVHPAKLEVRLSREKEVFSSLERLVRASLISSSPVSHWPGLDTKVKEEFSLAQAPASLGHTRQSSMPVIRQIADDAPKHSQSAEVLSELKILGQLQNTYIVAEGSNGMYLIDQHAAHERVLFEKVWSGFQSNANHIQGLLDPVVLEIPSHLTLGLEMDLEKWNRFGFEIEHFGGNSYLIRGVVDYIANRDVSSILFEILEELDRYPSETPEWVEGLAKSIACHSAVKSGDTMAMDEMLSLAIQLEGTDHPLNCPHGRPTMIRFERAELDRQFGRI